MINNSSFGFSPFKLNPKLEFYYLSIYSLHPTLLFSASNRSIGSLACSALGGRKRIARKGELEEGALPKCNLTSCTQIESCRGNT